MRDSWRSSTSTHRNLELNGLAQVYLRELFSGRHTDYDLRDSFRKLNFQAAYWLFET